MAEFLRENSRRTKSKAMAFTSGLTGKCTKVDGKKASKMDWVSIPI